MGDAAIDMHVNAIEYALQQHPRQDHRHRIEHCMLTDEPLVDRIAALGIVPVLNPSFLWVFGDGYLRDYGEERCSRFFQSRLFQQKGVRFAITSDAPIVTANPLMSIEIAVTRRTKGGHVLGSEQSIDVMQAIRACTIDAAYTGFEENIKGSIEPGKLADLVVLSGDILAIPPDQIHDLKADMTILDGNVVYQRAE
jgi:predicted amidohydrolase YtcJ